MATTLTPLISSSRNFLISFPFSIKLKSVVIRKATTVSVMATTNKIIDSHLHVWASPQEVRLNQSN